MGENSGISWTGDTWNPTTGCDRVSAGCDRCYALTTAARMKAMGVAAYQKDGNPATSGPGFGLTMHPDRLDIPLRKKRPRLYFTNSMSDLFHKDITDEFIADVFAVMACSPRHTFQMLTKRHGRMRSLLNRADWPDLVDVAIRRLMMTGRVTEAVAAQAPSLHDGPLPNLWLGVTVEDQAAADLRLSVLLRTPAAVRWASVEPLIGEVSLTNLNPGADVYVDALAGVTYDHGPDGVRHHAGLDWVVVGGESGAGARPMQRGWIDKIISDCSAGDVPVWTKQAGKVLAAQMGLAGKGDKPSEPLWPSSWVQEFPRESR